MLENKTQQLTAKSMCVWLNCKFNQILLQQHNLPAISYLFFKHAC
jgi:hypothetical protein